MSDDKVRLRRGDYYEGGEFFLRPSEHQHRDEYIARTVADDDARARELTDWRDTSMAAYAAAHGLDWKALTKEQLDAMEADSKAHGDKKAMDVVRRLYAKCSEATRDRDEWKARAERAEAERDAEKADRIAEVAEFNAGYVAYKAGKPLNEAEAEYIAGLPVTPEGYTRVSTPYDVFECGYAWAAWDDPRRDLREAKAERDEAMALLKASRRKHYECEDGWYSCPKAPDYIDGGGRGTECNCGADAWNARIDAALNDPTDDDRKGEDGEWCERSAE